MVFGTASGWLQTIFGGDAPGLPLTWWQIVSEHDLEESLRLNANINSLDEVELAMKERSGEIGIVKRTLAPQVIDVNVADGVQTVRIALVPVDHRHERPQPTPH